jgi:hypothetical protein
MNCRQVTLERFHVIIFALGVRSVNVAINASLGCQRGASGHALAPSCVRPGSCYKVQEITSRVCCAHSLARGEAAGGTSLGAFTAGNISALIRVADLAILSMLVEKNLVTC